MRTGGTNSVKYCYDVWLKHLSFLHQAGMEFIPKTLAEIGPGDSLGAGLSAMLCGTDTYYGLDVLPYANPARNIKVLECLADFFRKRKGRFVRGWPDTDPYLDHRLFPSHILKDSLLEDSLRNERVADIRSALQKADGTNFGGISVHYIIGNACSCFSPPASVDCILAHAVMEHVAVLDQAYRAFFGQLRPGGWMSLQIDFQSHDITGKWNGHWTYSDHDWATLQDKETLFLNRQPCSRHIELIERSGFTIECLLKEYRDDGVERPDLVERWQSLSDDDLRCFGSFIQARKPKS